MRSNVSLSSKILALVTDGRIFHILIDVHRLGRTARAGNDGTGFLILAPWEQRFLANKTMVSIPIQESDIKEEDVASSLQPWKDTIDRVMASLEEKPRCSAYQVCGGR